MDYDTSQKLMNLSRKIPKEWKYKGVKEIDVNRAQREKIEKMYYNGKIESNRKMDSGRTIIKEEKRLGNRERKVLGNMLKSGQLNKKTQEIDEKINEKIGRAWDDVIRAARERGDIPSKEEARRDYEKFMASRR